jgi:hypothetical protein
MERPHVAAAGISSKSVGPNGLPRVPAKLLTFKCLVTALALLGAVTIVSARVNAEEIDFGQIDRFESLATGTLHVGTPPKTIVDDGERHLVILTIWDADAETKVYWKSPDGNARTTIMPGKGIQTFQTAEEFRLEAIGEPNRRVEYGYMLLGFKK